MEDRRACLCGIAMVLLYIGMWTYECRAAIQWEAQEAELMTTNTSKRSH